MADNNHSDAAVETLFKGMNHFVTMKTVAGNAMRIGDAIILPLVDVTCGMAAGTLAENSKNRDGGGMSAKMSLSAVLVIQDGSTRLVNIENQNTVNKIPDVVPGIINGFTSGEVTVGEEFSMGTVKTAEEMASTEAEKTE